MPILSLPTELLLTISWLAANPSVYLVCKSWSNRLEPYADYEHDLALSLFAAQRPVGAWSMTGSARPWRTSEAKRAAPLTDRERVETQEMCLSLSWFTSDKFVKMCGWLVREWLENHCPTNEMGEQQLTKFNKALTLTTETFLFGLILPPSEEHPETWFRIRPGGQAVLRGSRTLSTSGTALHIIDIAVIPDWVFLPCLTPEKEHMLHIIRLASPNRVYMRGSDGINLKLRLNLGLVQDTVINLVKKGDASSDWLCDALLDTVIHLVEKPQWLKTMNSIVLRVIEDGGFNWARKRIGRYVLINEHETFRNIML